MFSDPVITFLPVGTVTESASTEYGPNRDAVLLDKQHLDDTAHFLVNVFEIF